MISEDNNIVPLIDWALSITQPFRPVAPNPMRRVPPSLSMTGTFTKYSRPALHWSMLKCSSGYGMVPVLTGSLRDSSMV